MELPPGQIPLVFETFIGKELGRLVFLVLLLSMGNLVNPGLDHLPMGSEFLASDETNRDRHIVQIKTGVKKITKTISSIAFHGYREFDETLYLTRKLC